MLNLLLLSPTSVSLTLSFYPRFNQTYVGIVESEHFVNCKARKSNKISILEKANVKF